MRLPGTNPSHEAGCPGWVPGAEVGQDKRSSLTLLPTHVQNYSGAGSCPQLWGQKGLGTAGQSFCASRRDPGGTSTGFDI